MQAITERIKVIDTDSHVLEPPDLWTSRLAGKWDTDTLPHVRRDPDTGEEAWYIGGEKELSVGNVAMAGASMYFPDKPNTYAEIVEAACSDSKARLRRLDDFGIFAQVFYPNVGGFGAGSYLRLREPELMLDCVRAYNDFAIEWASADPRRLIPIMTVPFWDIDQTLAELRRGIEIGHKGVLVGSEPETFGLPPIADPYWEPLWSVAEEAGVSINFHIGSGDKSFRPKGHPAAGRHANMAKATVLMFLGNARAVAEVIFSGICHRHPHLNFVSVESGLGWVPFMLEAMDWQWLNDGVHLEHPEYDLLPSDYFRRQIYACFWFEKETPKRVIDFVGPDNIMFETDYPHPTSLSPGPASIAEPANEFLAAHYGDLAEEWLRKILHDNAARIYHLDS